MFIVGSLLVALWVLVPYASARPPPFHHPANPYPTSPHWTPAETDGSDALAQAAFHNTARYLHGYRNTKSSCSVEQAIRRKEWDSLSDNEKRDYIRAVRCLQTKPSISGNLVPGARNRYDDFVATHVNQTYTIHNTVRPRYM